MRTETDIRTLKDLREYYRALSDAARLKILAQLARRDATVSELARGLRISQPLVSWHLHRLKIAGLIRMKRNGREVHCSLDRARLDAYARQFDSLIANQ
jgi:ArsR family transcriptional regulator